MKIRMLLPLITLAILAGCTSMSMKPYNNKYGGFDNKADADCAFLVFQRDAKKELGDKWDAVYQKCRQLSEEGAPLTPVVYNELKRNPNRTASQGGGTTLAALAQILQQLAVIQQQQAEIQATKAQQARDSMPKTTNCHAHGNTMNCTTW